MGVQTDRQTGVLTFTICVSLCGRLKYKIWALVQPSVEHYSSIDCCSRRPTNIDLATVRPENISVALSLSLLCPARRVFSRHEILHPKSTQLPSGCTPRFNLLPVQFDVHALLCLHGSAAVYNAVSGDDEGWSRLA